MGQRRICDDSGGTREPTVSRGADLTRKRVTMSGWRLREFHSDDLDGILRLWEQTHRDGSEPVYALSEVLASC